MPGTTNMPGALDTFSAKKDVDLEAAVKAIERVVVGPTHVNIAAHASWDPVASDNRAAVQGTHDSAPVGAVIHVPHAKIGLSAPVSLTKCLHWRGAGKFASRFVATADTSSPLITLDVTAAGDGVYDAFGASFDGFAIDMSAAPSAIGLRLTTNTQWATFSDMFIRGGTTSIDHHAPNATFDDLIIQDPSNAMWTMDEEGFELHLSRIRMAAQTRNVAAYMKIIVASGGGAKGALYFDDVTMGTAGGSIVATDGVIFTAPSITEVPTFWNQVIVDNVTGGGPTLTLTNIQTFGAFGGWMNGTHGNVKMDGCVGTRFRDMRMRGGTHTYEWVGALSNGFESECETFTGPYYKISTTNKPTEVHLNDWCPGATDIGQVTNDPAWLESSARRTWGQKRFQGMIRHREGGVYPPSGFVTLSGGVAVVSHPGVQTNTRVRVWHESLGSTPGIICSQVSENVVGTSFTIRSTSGTDNASVYWEMVGDAD